MAWKMATAYIISAETKVPDAVYSFAIARDMEPYGMLQPIKRDPLELWPMVPLGPEQCGEEFLRMLPSGKMEIDAGTLAQLEEVFGLEGEMEAQPVN